MQAVKTIGLDIAKSVFQVHGVDAEGKIVVRRRPHIGAKRTSRELVSMSANDPKRALV
jgi:hypothetical protein